MPRRVSLLSSRDWALCAGLLLPLTSVLASASPREQPTASPPPERVVVVHKAKPRSRLAVGDRWHVRCSQLPLQQQDPSWSSPETWVFAVTGVEKTPDGQRLIVTATREGAPKPTVKLQLDPVTQAIMRADTQIPVPGGVRDFVERPAPDEPFVSEVSPVLIALPTPDGSQPPPKTESPSPPTGEGPALIFSFGQRYHQKTDPVDAGVGQAKIQRGMEPLRRRREAGLEPTGIPRYVTVIDGPGSRIDEVWDESTPWPLYSETQASRCWLVDYQKGK